MKQKNYQLWSRPLLLMLLSLVMTVGGTSSVWAQVTEDFESATVTDAGLSLTTSNGKWNVVGTEDKVGIATDTSKDIQYKTGYAGRNDSQSAVGNGFNNSNSWIITPVQVTGTVTYWVKKGSNSMSADVRKATWNAGTNTFDIDNSNLQSATFSGSNWTQNSVNVGETPTYIAFKISKSWLDDVTYTPYVAPEGAALTVKDGATKVTSPYAFNFELAAVGDTHTFTLSNPGTAALEGLSVSETGSANFSATLSATSIAAGGEATLTITMPAATGSSAITVSNTSGVDAFVINASGTYESNMVITQPASLSFGAIEQTGFSNKTFTIANTGNAPLENITVTTSESEVLEYAFHISDAPTSLAAGASQEVTIKMGGQVPLTILNVGYYSTDIKVNATGKEEVKFTVEGAVIGNATPKEEFTSGLPTNWTNAGWTFANGEATGKSGSAYLTTPKLNSSEGNFIVIKAKAFDADTGNYLTVQGSTDNGENYSQLKKIEFPANSNTEYTSYIISGIPAGVNKIRFIGYYAVVDEITNLNYAPALSVTTGEPATTVNTPADYDFGECAANASVTYNFANTGGGTINITNVAITGEGAAAYSTNWTESAAAPFALTITRSYDAERVGASAAVVTVTTSEGNFVINVTGTDKAANAPELAVTTNAINFGKVTADAVETVTVTNNGTGSMDVTIASDNAVFEVSTASLTGIGAGQSKTFDITFKYGTPYGVKNGNVTVTPSYDAGAAQVITVTGKAKDPTTWSEDFSSNTLPTGWEAGDNWTIADGAAKGSYEYGKTNYLTTAPLTVSGTTDEMTFDYVATTNYVNIVIQKSKDGGEFTDLHTISGLNNSDAGSYTITGLEAGTYQFRFKNDDYNLDNFEGFVLNLPDHMATITASSIPESSSYSVTMKVTKSFNATVTVKELRGVAEELTAKLYMGEEVIGTKAGSVAANGTETLTITCTPTVAATEGAQMHIEVEWAGTKMTTANVTRYVAALTNLTLSENSSDAVAAGTYDNLTLQRQFAAGWNTVCLPFDIDDVETFFGAGAKAYRFSGFTDGELGFTTTSSLTASFPYIVHVPSAITEDIELHDIEITAGNVDPFYQSQNFAYFRGTYAPIAAGGWTKLAETDVIYGVSNAGTIAPAKGSTTMKGFRAYFDLPAGTEARLSIDGEIITGVNGVKEVKGVKDDSWYDLQGRRVENAKKGMYIVNGKKVVVK